MTTLMLLPPHPRFPPRAASTPMLPPASVACPQLESQAHDHYTDCVFESSSHPPHCHRVALALKPRVFFFPSSRTSSSLPPTRPPRSRLQGTRTLKSLVPCQGQEVVLFALVFNFSRFSTHGVCGPVMSTCGTLDELRAQVSLAAETCRDGDFFCV